MADQQIDELSLKIEVKENNTAKTLTAISSAIDKLTSSLKALSKFSTLIDQVAKIKLPSATAKTAKASQGAAPKLRTETVPTNPYKEVQNPAYSFQDIRDFGSRLRGELTNIQKPALEMATNIKEVIARGMEEAAEKVREKAEQVKDAYENVKNSMQLVSSETRMSADGTQKQIEKFELLEDGLKRTVTAIDGVIVAEKELKQAQKDNNEETGVSATAFSKLVKSVGRIAFYRLIRTAIKEIAQAAKEGLENLRAVDKELDTSLNKISLDMTMLKNSFASVLSPIVKAFEPIITRISDAIARLANRLNEAQAKLRGDAKYTRILTSDTEEYRKELQKVNGELLSFDTFTTLGKGTGYTGVIESDVTMSGEEAAKIMKNFDGLEDIADNLSGILGFLSNIIDKIGELKDKLGINYLDIIKSSLNGIKTVLNAIDFILSLISGDTDRIKESFSKLKESLKNGGLIEAISNPIGHFFGELIRGIIKGISDAIKEKTGINSLFSGIKGWSSGGVNGIKSILGFADGGNYRTGDFFVANENGATEMIASTNNGGSVMNIDQWASISYSSFFRALSDYGAARDDNGNVTISADTIGKALAGNRGFISEMNRRNGALNLR